MTVSWRCTQALLVTCLRSNGMIFFFSSRRRHTRLQGDWSSDVCSSDLVRRDPGRGAGGGPGIGARRVRAVLPPRRRCDRSAAHRVPIRPRSEEHTSELQSPCNLVCRLLLEKKKHASALFRSCLPHSAPPS